MDTPHRRFTSLCRYVTAAGLLASCCASLAQAEEPFTVEVAAGPFDVFVTETARLDAKQSVTLSSELPSNTGKIVWLLPEGDYVERGAAVARFDPAPFETEMQQHSRELQDARATLVQAEAELQIKIRRNEESKEQLEHAIAVAELKLENLRKAEHPLRLATARNEVLAARTALLAARRELEAQREMLNEGFGSEAALADAAAVERERANALALSERQLELLQSIILPAELQQAELELASKRRELERGEQINLHSLAKQNAALVRLTNKVAELEQTLAASKDLLAKTTIEAPVSGFVVYKQISVMNERRKPQVGDSVWNRHGFMVIPDMSAMIAHADVRELDVGKLAEGQAVTLYPEAHPDLTLTGRVDSVGTLAADGSSSEENLFRVRIALDELDPRLRPGMRARASILTRHHDAVLRVPIEAVFYERGTPICFLWTRGAARRQSVTIGESDGEYVIVTSGLERGDRVLLSRPMELVAGN